MAVERDLTPILMRAAQESLSITLTGPRQSGKTTLCRAVFPHLPYVSLEAPDVRAFASEDPRAFLAQFPSGAVIDEVQRVPDLASYLQGAIDSAPEPGRWILTGSQSFALAESVSQSLAGRTAVHHLLPLARTEVVRFNRHPEARRDVARRRVPADIRPRHRPVGLASLLRRHLHRTRHEDHQQRREARGVSAVR